MKHPPPQEWMSLLYGEAPPSRAAALEAHLQSCPDCARQVQTWKGSKWALDTWRLEGPPVHARPLAWLKWAALIALLVTGGFSLGRVSAPAGPDLATLQSHMDLLVEEKLRGIEADLLRSTREQQQEFLRQSAETILGLARAHNQQLLQDFALQMQQQSARDQETFLALVGQLRAEVQSDYASLRRELETVAFLTEAGLQNTQNQLFRLAQFKPTLSPP